jgi:cation diffusion facilitator family transporter
MSTARPSQRKRAAILSLSVGVGMLLLKSAAYVVTGSAAVFSDALESVVHVAATAFALYSVIVSARPPDIHHPYGHGKVEFFSAGFEGALIVVAAAAILVEVARSVALGRLPQRLDAGILMTLAAGAVNLSLGWFLLRTGKRTASLTLVADGRHVLTDAYTSLGVVAGLVGVRLTGWTLLDPLVATAVAVNILVTGGKLMRESVSGLMDEADADTLEDILAALGVHRRPEWVDVHNLRCWRAGERLIMDLHLTVPRYWEIAQGHAAQDELEQAVFAHLRTDGEAIVHLDPCVEACCPHCAVEACPVRAHQLQEQRKWTVAGVTGGPFYLAD